VVELKNLRPDGTIGEPEAEVEVEETETPAEEPAEA
jgi:trigger factor